MSLHYLEAKRRLQPIEWLTPNRMKLNSGHVAFDEQVKCVSTGNVWGGGQFSNYIRAFNQIECNGKTDYAEGHLQAFDLKPYQRPQSVTPAPSYVIEYVKEAARNQSVILYQFYHVIQGRKRVHGYIVTDTRYQFLRSFVTARHYKSENVILAVTPYVSWKAEDYADRPNDFIEIHH